MTEKKFKFEMRQEVQLILSKEKGRIIGRAEYDSGTPNSYYLRLLSADGRQIEDWFSEAAITALEIPGKGYGREE